MSAAAVVVVAAVGFLALCDCLFLSTDLKENVQLRDATLASIVVVCWCIGKSTCGQC